MVGKNQSAAKLNNTLIKIVKILTDNKILNWFVSYGTLLGIIRDNSCIDQDDDIDIICNGVDYDIIKKIFIANGFTLNTNHGIGKSRGIIKTNETKEYSSIDFYMTELDNKGNFNDKWNNVVWSGCYLDNELIEYPWNGLVLYVPNNYTNKLIGRYGDQWKIPKNSKGPIPHKKII